MCVCGLQAVATGGAGRKLLTGGRRLLATAAEIQQRADVVFVGFVFMTLLDLGLLVLFGIQHPHCKQRSPRVYISGGSVDQGCVQQGGGKEGGRLQRPTGSGQISLQVRPVAFQVLLGTLRWLFMLSIWSTAGLLCLIVCLRRMYRTFVLSCLLTRCHEPGDDRLMQDSYEI